MSVVFRGFFPISSGRQRQGWRPAIKMVKKDAKGAFMEPRIILVTGSTDGIGRQTAQDLAAGGHHVILHGRNENRCKETAATIAEATGSRTVDSICADLASLESVRGLADNLLERYPHIDVLINNAGVFERHRRLSEDGFEMTLAVNHLAPFLLTGLLLDRVKKSTAGRIVNVSSMVHAQTLDLRGLQGEKPYDGFEAYSQTKLCNVLFTSALAVRLRDTRVTVNCLHPGVINTKLLRENWHGGSPVTQGSKTSVYLATDPGVSDVTGLYFVNRKPARPARVAQDESVRQELWQLSETWTGFVYAP